MIKAAILPLMLAVPALAQQAWTPEEFPVGYWFGPPASENRLETWQTVKDCGFTFAGPRGGYSVEQNKTQLDLCAQVGLKALVVDPRIDWLMTSSAKWKDVLAAVVADYRDHPALYGYYIVDEPNYQQFEALGLISRELEALDPAHLPYINLLPTYASVDQLGTPTYADHLDRFLSITQPRVLSYDHYCLLKNGKDRLDYFENLRLIRDAGLRYGVPPWNIILSLPHLGYRDPTAGEMRWQVYTSLAYGMKGIMWFTYWTDPSWQKSGEVAIVDSEGKPARLYPVVRALNFEIQRLGQVLLGLTSTGVYHTGEQIPAGCTRLGTDAIVRFAEDVPLVVGLFEDAEGAQYAMITNSNHDEPVDVVARFKPHVTGIALVPALDGQNVDVDGNTVRMTLEPGGGRLLKLETEFRYPEPPALVDRIAFQFDQGGELEGWGGFGSLSSPVVRDGILSLDMGRSDPLMCRRFLDIAPDLYRAIKVRMRLSGGAPTAQFFWATDLEPGYADDKYLNFAIQPDWEWHEYTIPVAEHPKWKGQRITAIRLDPTVAGPEDGGKLEIDWIIGE
ncbi:MAG: hypothetical protein QM473_20510 [Acidobacteriota bacterium]|nr:hypothetical protein [Acidobacteriota bacterium]